MCKMDPNKNDTPIQDQNNIPNGNEKSETKRPSKKMCANHKSVKLHVEPIVENNSGNIEIVRATAVEKSNGHYV